MSENGQERYASLLLVEDDRDWSNRIKAALCGSRPSPHIRFAQTMRFDVEQAFSAQSAEELLSRKTYDLVVVDLLLPEDDSSEEADTERGLRIIDAIDRMRQTQDTICVVSSRYQQQFGDALQRGSLICVMKLEEAYPDIPKAVTNSPLGPEELAALITVAIQQRREWIRSETLAFKAGWQGALAFLTQYYARRINSSLIGVSAELEVLSGQFPKNHPAQDGIKAARDQLANVTVFLKGMREQLGGWLETRSPGNTTVVAALLTGCRHMLWPWYREKGISLRLGDVDPQLRVQGHENPIRYALLNLLLNAVEAIDWRAPPEQKQIILTAGPCRTTPGMVEIEVSDTGPGISDEALDHLFEPGVSTPDRRVDGHLGVGLASSHTIVRYGLAGKLIVRRNEQRPGTDAIVQIPIAE